jgi:hypothetical protein
LFRIKSAGRHCKAASVSSQALHLNPCWDSEWIWLPESPGLRNSSQPLVARPSRPVLPGSITKRAAGVEGQKSTWVSLLMPSTQLKSELSVTSEGVQTVPDCIDLFLTLHRCFEDTVSPWFQSKSELWGGRGHGCHCYVSGI